MSGTIPPLQVRFHSVVLNLPANVKVKKGKEVPLHAMEEHGVRGDIAPAHS
jgi:hypothetical protein